jgi:sRNA-binding regulator protein Hfq
MMNHQYCECAMLQVKGGQQLISKHAVQPSGFGGRVLSRHWAAGYRW